MMLTAIASKESVSAISVTIDAYSVSLGGYLEDSYYDELSGMYVASSYDLPSLDDVYIKS